MSEDAAYARDPSTLTSILRQFEGDGFTGQFAVRDGARLACLTCGREHEAQAIQLAALRRTEGASDPADMAAVVGLTCPACGTRGTAVLNYGPAAGIEESDVLAALEDRRSGTGVIVDSSTSPDTLT